MTRCTLRRWLFGWLAVAILFTQVATAAHACAQMSVPGEPCADMTQMAHALTPDADAPGICQQHCQPDAAGKTADVSSAVALALVAVLLFVLAPRTRGRPICSMRQRRRDRAPPPPHSILHCCHRI